MFAAESQAAKVMSFRLIGDKFPYISLHWGLFSAPPASEGFPSQAVLAEWVQFLVWGDLDRRSPYLTSESIKILLVCRRFCWWKEGFFLILSLFLEFLSRLPASTHYDYMNLEDVRALISSKCIPFTSYSFNLCLIHAAIKKCS